MASVQSMDFEKPVRKLLVRELLQQQVNAAGELVWAVTYEFTPVYMDEVEPPYDHVQYRFSNRNLLYHG